MEDQSPPGRLGVLAADTDIMRCRAAFSAYNVSRIRELIRNLNPRTYRVFQLIPFWLHVNAPEIPGFVNSSRAFFGIYRFRETGFFKQALVQLNLTEKRLRPYLCSPERIQGLYLMGSSGTLAQTDTSDFDYWVVVNKKEMEPTDLTWLQNKLLAIQDHCRIDHGMPVTFFLLDASQVRENRFDLLNEESSGSAQRTLLKEEFYRTFIMISGRIPYWAVLPVSPDDGYRERIASAVNGHQLSYFPEDYIDLGNLSALNRQECAGALLWQVVKVRHSPAKSFIKGASIAHYFFFMKEGFLCDLLKARFLEGAPAEDNLVDPYVLLFDKSLSFFKTLEDQEGASLLKECIFLRLNGSGCLSASYGDTPRRALLLRFVAQWGWDNARIHRLASFRQWPESEKLRFEKDIFNKLSFLYELMRQEAGAGKGGVDMNPRDLAILTGQIAAHFRREPGKIPACSAYVRTHGPKYQIIVSARKEVEPVPHWDVYGLEGKRKVNRETLLFEGAELLKITGWLILNGLYHREGSGITFQGDPPAIVTGNQAHRFVRTVYAFFRDRVPGPTPADLKPSWTRLLVCLHHPSTGFIRSDAAYAEFLALNTWGEFYYDIIPLSSMETEALACYAVAEHIGVLMDKSSPAALRWLVLPSAGSRPGPAEDLVSRYIEQFSINLQKRRAFLTSSEIEPKNRPGEALLLDR